MVTPGLNRLERGFLLLLSTQVFACGGQMVGWGTPDETDPRVSSVTPEDEATNVSINASFTATFSEVMDPATITGVTFQTDRGSTAIAGEVIYTGVTGVFSPKFNLLPNATYTATITTGAQDPAGNRLANDYEWSFSTGAAVDADLPFVTGTNPDDDATNVSVNSAIIASFSERMMPSSINESTFRLNNGVVAISGTVTAIGATAIFRVEGDLAPDTEYTAVIDQDVTDLAGNGMTEDHVWTFRTSAFLDIDRPMVILTDPDDHDFGVSVDTTVAAQFSEPMDPQTLTTANFELTGPGPTSIQGTVNHDALSLSATFTPNNDLSPGILYTARITTGAEDLSGNAMAQDYTWEFTTTATDPAPIVTLTNPDDNDIQVPANTTVSAAFSEPMDPLTLIDANFDLIGPAPGFFNVPGVVTNNALGTSLTFTPTDNLSPGTIYTATVTTGVEDLGGNGLAQNYSWTFTTAAADPPPTILFTDPDDLETNVAVDTLVSAQFSEPMDPATLIDANFDLVGPAPTFTPVPGIVTHDALSTALFFTPDNDLADGVTYIATVTTGAEDLAGNALAQAYQWSFTTVITPPTVTFTDPDDLDTDVSVSTLVSAEFSVPMDPLTLDTVTFTVAGPSGIPLLGTVDMDLLSLVATFTPDVDLFANTIYTATITTGAEDADGTPLATDYIWTFTTGLAGGLQPVDLGTLDSFVAAAGAGLTNSNTAGTTVLNGNVALYPTPTCTGNGVPCTATNPTINGTLYAADIEGVAAQAKTDLDAAYIDAQGRTRSIPEYAVLAGIYTPGVYTSSAAMDIAGGMIVTLDGMGDPNAVFIFQVGTALTAGDNVQIVLINDARADNVYWAVGSTSTLGNDVSFQGSVLAGASNVVGTNSTVIGRLLCSTGQITLLSNTLSLPPL